MYSQYSVCMFCVLWTHVGHIHTGCGLGLDYIMAVNMYFCIFHMHGLHINYLYCLFVSMCAHVLISLSVCSTQGCVFAFVTFNFLCWCRV